MASMRNLAISIPRLAQQTDAARALRCPEALPQLALFLFGFQLARAAQQREPRALLTDSMTLGQQ